MNKKKNLYTTILKVVIAAGLLFVIFYRTDFSEIFATIKESNIVLLIMALITFFITFGVFMSLRLYVLIKDYFPNFFLCFKLSFIGIFLNNFLPTNIGGDGYKIYYLKKNLNKKWGKPFVIILADRVSGSLMNVLLFIAYLIFHPEIMSVDNLNAFDSLEINQKKILIFFLMILLVFIFSAVFFLFRNKNKLFLRIKQFIHDCIIAIKEITVKKFILLNLVSLLFHIFRGIGFYFLILYLQGDIFIIDVILLLFLTTFIGFIPITIGAFGTLEGAIILSLILLDISVDCAKGVAILYRAILIMVSATGGIFFVNFKRKTKIEDIQKFSEELDIEKQLHDSV